MALPPDACSLIVQNVADSRSTLVSLCTVSKQFKIAAERALYNTLELSGHERITQVCTVLARNPRLAMLVVALSVHGEDDDDTEEEDPEDSEEPPFEMWQSLCFALRQTTRLRFLNLYFQDGAQTDKAWILHGVTFQLRTFHCDLTWSEHLAGFLSTQTRLSNLFLADFRDSLPSPPLTPSPDAMGRVPPISGSSSQPPRPLPHLPTSPVFLPKLSVLECTFSEAAAALVPGRPVVRLKTCFTHSKPEQKRAELQVLLGALRRSRRRLRALDIADSAYTPDFTLELLGALTADGTFCTDLRYVGTLVLPVDGHQRLEFYGLLMRMRQLRCLEVDVSEWEPSPIHAAALRALTCEIRLYCPSVTAAVFVYDFERHLVRVAGNGQAVYDEEGVTEDLWRET